MWNNYELVELPGDKPNAYFLIITDDKCNLCPEAKKTLARAKLTAPAFYSDRANFPAIKGVPQIRFVKDDIVVGKMIGSGNNQLSNFAMYYSFKHLGRSRIWLSALMFYSSILNAKNVYKQNKAFMAPKEIKKHRRDLCKGCDKRVGLACGECFCIIGTKTAVFASSCPIGKW